MAQISSQNLFVLKNNVTKNYGTKQPNKPKMYFQSIFDIFSVFLSSYIFTPQ